MATAVPGHSLHPLSVQQGLPRQQAAVHAVKKKAIKLAEPAALTVRSEGLSIKAIARFSMHSCQEAVLACLAMAWHMSGKRVLGFWIRPHYHALNCQASSLHLRRRAVKQWSIHRSSRMTRPDMRGSASCHLCGAAQLQRPPLQAVMPDVELQTLQRKQVAAGGLSSHTCCANGPQYPGTAWQQLLAC